MSAVPRRGAPARPGARSMVDFYLTTARPRSSASSSTARHYFYMLGMIAEPVIYLVVWTTIAEQQGGSVRGSPSATSPRTTSSGRSSGT